MISKLIDSDANQQVINLMSKPNLIVDKTFHFSLMVIELCNALDEKKKFAISNQLLRSA